MIFMYIIIQKYIIIKSSNISLMSKDKITSQVRKMINERKLKDNKKIVKKRIRPIVNK
jgi:hypothetical protein